MGKKEKGRGGLKPMQRTRFGHNILSFFNACMHQKLYSRSGVFHYLNSLSMDSWQVGADSDDCGRYYNGVVRIIEVNLTPLLRLMTPNLSNPSFIINTNITRKTTDVPTRYTVDKADLASPTIPALEGYHPRAYKHDAKQTFFPGKIFAGQSQLITVITRIEKEKRKNIYPGVKKRIKLAGEARQNGVGRRAHLRNYLGSFIS